MNEVAFVEQREPDWMRLVYLCERADVSPHNLSEVELEELVALYRRCSADLALVRTKSANIELIAFLNDHVSRAYSVLYRMPRKPFGKAVGDAIRLAANTVRKLQYFVLASFLTLVAGIAFAYVASGNKDMEDILVPGQAHDVFSQWKSGNLPDRDASESAGTSMLYMSHNPLVSIIAGSAAAGSFGIFSAMELWENGVILGALMREMNSVGKLPFLLLSILPHGVTELSGIVLSGAAGYALGWALIAPGRRRRREALYEAGKDAIVVLCTSVVLMFIAAPVEGFFSFNPRIPVALKAIFIFLAAGAWALFWLGYGRDKPEATQSAPLEPALKS